MTDEPNVETLLIELILVFQQSAWQAMGKVQNPLSGKTEVQLPQARHAIDMLAMLETKTRGNLSEAEQKFLANALTQLRLNYVDEVREAGNKAPAQGDGPKSDAKSSDGGESPASSE